MKKPYITAAALMWAASFQYFAVQIVVAFATHNYSFLSNSISDLGNTACAMFEQRFICSAMPWLMNISFLALGAGVLVGAILFAIFYESSRRSRLAFSLIGIAAIGIILVGSFPENINPTLHFVGADMSFLSGIIAILMIGLGLGLPKLIRYYSIISAFVAAVGLILIVTHSSLWSGAGASERAAATTEIAWLVVFGGYIFIKSMRSRAVKEAVD